MLGYLICLFLACFEIVQKKFSLKILRNSSAVIIVSHCMVWAGVLNAFDEIKLITCSKWNRNMFFFSRSEETWFKQLSVLKRDYEIEIAIDQLHVLTLLICCWCKNGSLPAFATPRRVHREA